MKQALVILGSLAIFGGSYYCSTQIGLRTNGSLDVQFEAPKPPVYTAVGQNLYSQDGTKLMVTSISRESGMKGSKHVIRASVKGTHRYALQLFPTRMVHTFLMDKKAVERTVLEAVGTPPGDFIASSREWHQIQ